MSVMIVSDETYNKVASTLEHHKLYGRMYGVQKILWNVDIQKFIEKIRAANYQSYAERYREETEIPPFKFRQAITVNEYQLIKSLDCIAYNIELEQFDGSETLYKLMNAIRKHIVMRLPEYDNAAWG